MPSLLAATLAIALWVLILLVLLVVAAAATVLAVVAVAALQIYARQNGVDVQVRWPAVLRRRAPQPSPASQPSPGAEHRATSAGAPAAASDRGEPRSAAREERAGSSDALRRLRTPREAEGRSGQADRPAGATPAPPQQDVPRRAPRPAPEQEVERDSALERLFAPLTENDRTEPLRRPSRASGERPPADR